MIDLHCHILPAIDDGARDLAEAISLVKLSLEQGVTHIVCTPHIHAGRYDNSLGEIEQVFNVFQQSITEADIDVKLACAAEVRIDADIMALIELNELPFLGLHEGRKVLLLEMPYSHIPPGFDRLAKWLLKKGIVPLIAHPERNRELQKSPHLIKWLKGLGCLLQGTASSITGLFGEKPQQVIEYMLKNGLVDIIASDCHSLKRRPPEMASAFELVSSNYGLPLAHEIFLNRPRKISAEKFINNA